MSKVSAFTFVFAAAIMATFLLWSNRAVAGKGTILAFGDSLTAAYGLPLTDGFPAQLEKHLRSRGHDVKVVNAGVSGETSSGALTRFEWTLQNDPDYVILETGANDMLRAINPAVTRKNIDAMLGMLKARNIPVLLAGMKALPTYGTQYNIDYQGIYRDLAEKHGAVFYPFFLDGVALDPALNLPDGAHPNAAGISVIVGNITPYVEALLKRGKGG